MSEESEVINQNDKAETLCCACACVTFAARIYCSYLQIELAPKFFCDISPGDGGNRVAPWSDS